MNGTSISYKMKEQILQFSGVLSKYLPKTGRRFMAEMLFGIQARQSVRLSEVTRALDEPIALKKTEERLCRQLDRPSLMRHLRHQLLWMARSRIKDDTLLILDTSDISKKYAQKMEYMAGVHDGSTGDKGYGYWLLNVVAASVGSTAFTPLYMHLYSQNAPEYLSENRQIMDAFDAVIPYAENRGTWVIDRGGDRSKLFDALLERKQDFIVRLQGKRHLNLNGFALSARVLADHCNCRYHDKIIKEKDGRTTVCNVAYGCKKIRLPEHKHPMYLVVVRGFGKEPMMLLTNRHVKQTDKGVRYILDAYIKRWSIEETFRLMKQSYKLEDIRILTYRRLQNMILIVMAAIFFACVWLGNRLKLRILSHHAMTAAKRFFGIPDFKFYAITDGIREIIGKMQGLKNERPTRTVNTTQMDLFKT